MKKTVLSIMIAVYVLSFVGCAEYKVSDLTSGLMTMNTNGQKEIKEEQQKIKE